MSNKTILFSIILFSSIAVAAQPAKLVNVSLWGYYRDLETICETNYLDRLEDCLSLNIYDHYYGEEETGGKWPQLYVKKIGQNHYEATRGATILIDYDTIPFGGITKDYSYGNNTRKKLRTLERLFFPDLIELNSYDNVFQKEECLEKPSNITLPLYFQDFYKINKTLPDLLRINLSSFFIDMKYISCVVPSQKRGETTRMNNQYLYPGFKIPTNTTKEGISFELLLYSTNVNISGWDFSIYLGNDGEPPINMSLVDSATITVDLVDPEYYEYEAPGEEGDFAELRTRVLFKNNDTVDDARVFVVEKDRKTVAEASTIDGLAEFRLEKGEYTLEVEFCGETLTQTLSMERDTEKTVRLSENSFRVLFVPVNWEKGWEEFDKAAEKHLGVFVKNTELSECPQKTKIIKQHKNCDISLQCSTRDLYKVWRCGLAPAHRIIGLTTEKLCDGQTTGYTLRYGDTSLVGLEYFETSAHELGHSFGLCDEYSYLAWETQNNVSTCPNQYPSDCEKCENMCCQGNHAGEKRCLMGAFGNWPKTFDAVCKQTINQGLENILRGS